MHATPRRRLRPRWAWSVLVLIAVTSMTLGLIRLQETACAVDSDAPHRPAAAKADPGPGAVQRGTAVYHDDWSVVLCSLAPLKLGGHYASVSAAAFDRAALCGAYLDVTGPTGTVRAQIVDRCRGCAGGRIDLSRDAFARVGDVSRGVVPVRYRLVRDPMPPGRLAFRLKPGSSAGWLALVVLDHGNPIDRLELRGADGAGWRPLLRGIDNHWKISRPGPGPFQVRVTDRYGRQVVFRRLVLTPGETQLSRVRLYEPRPAPFTASQSAVPVPVPPAPSKAPPASEEPPETSPKCP